MVTTVERITANSKHSEVMKGSIVIPGNVVRWGDENGYDHVISGARNLMQAYREAHPKLKGYHSWSPEKLRATIEKQEARLRRLREIALTKQVGQ